MILVYGSFLAVIIIAAAIIEFYIINKANRKLFIRYDLPQFTRYLTCQDVSGYCHDTVHFQSGKALLTGYLFNTTNSNGLIVIAHGLSGGSETYLPQIMYFVDKGWSVFSYDCTGSFHSEGVSTVGLAQSVLDLESALRFIENVPELSNLPIMLYGHSWGGYAVTAILNLKQNIKASVSLSGYNSPNEVLTYMLKKLTKGSWISIFAFISRPFIYIFHKVIFGRNATIAAIHGINTSNIPVMIIHGLKDNVIDIDGPSIISKKRQITNQNIVYEVTKGGHFDVFRTKNASQYMSTLDLEYTQLKSQYNGNIPYERQAEYYSKIDKKRYCELDDKLMGRIHEFYIKNR